MERPSLHACPSLLGRAHRYPGEKLAVRQVSANPRRLCVSAAPFRRTSRRFRFDAGLAYPFADFRRRRPRPVLAAISIGTMSGDSAGSGTQPGFETFGCL